MLALFHMLCEFNNSHTNVLGISGILSFYLRQFYSSHLYKQPDNFYIQFSELLHSSLHFFAFELLTERLYFEILLIKFTAYENESLSKINGYLCCVKPILEDINK